MVRPVSTDIGINLESKNRGAIISLFNAAASGGMFVGSICAGFLFHT